MLTVKHGNANFSETLKTIAKMFYNNYMVFVDLYIYITARDSEMCVSLHLFVV